MLSIPDISTYRVDDVYFINEDFNIAKVIVTVFHGPEAVDGEKVSYLINTKTGMKKKLDSYTFVWDENAEDSAIY